ncbi:MAG: hypothetical protein WD225_01805, partial [Ilumatobacteraceae bacterium]
ASVADGAAVLDSHGHLVGLLIDDGDGARLLPVHHTLDDMAGGDRAGDDRAGDDMIGDVSDGDGGDGGGAATARD